MQVSLDVLRILLVDTEVSSHIGGVKLYESSLFFGAMPPHLGSQRCDGVKPVCGSCANAQPPRECRYDDGGTSHTAALQKSISQLESRIRQLEQGEPVIGASTVFLHNPYSDALSPHNSRMIVLFLFRILGLNISE